MKINKEKIKEAIIKNLKWIILFICVICFLELAEEVFHNEIMKRDIRFYNTNSKDNYKFWWSYLSNYDFNSSIISDKK